MGIQTIHRLFLKKKIRNDKNIGVLLLNFSRPYMGSLESQCIKVIPQQQQQQQQPGPLADLRAYGRRQKHKFYWPPLLLNKFRRAWTWEKRDGCSKKTER